VYKLFTNSVQNTIMVLTW